MSDNAPKTPFINSNAVPHTRLQISNPAKNGKSVVPGNASIKNTENTHANRIAFNKCQKSVNETNTDPTMKFKKASLNRYLFLQLTAGLNHCCSFPVAGNRYANKRYHLFFISSIVALAITATSNRITIVAVILLAYSYRNTVYLKLGLI